MANLMVTVLAGYVDSSLPAEEQVRRIAELRSIVRSIEMARGLDLVNRTMHAASPAPVGAVNSHTSRVVASKAQAQIGDWYPSNTGSWYHRGHVGVVGCGRACRCGAIAPAALTAPSRNTVSGAPAVKAAVKPAVKAAVKVTYSVCTDCKRTAKEGYEWYSPRCPKCRAAYDRLNTLAE